MLILIKFAGFNLLLQLWLQLSYSPFAEVKVKTAHDDILEGLISLIRKNLLSFFLSASYQQSDSSSFTLGKKIKRQSRFFREILLRKFWKLEVFQFINLIAKHFLSSAILQIDFFDI